MKDDMKVCNEILAKLKKHAKAAPFLEPVDYVTLKLMDYPAKITNPMDFHTITNKMKNYKSKTEFIHDVKLIFSNCYSYNGENAHVSKMARDLEIYFDVILSKYVKNNVDLDACTSILNEITKSKHKKFNWPFLEPVDVELVPNYLNIVEKPMDLSTIRKKLTNYQNRFEFFSDLILMIRNCFKFNAPESEVYKCGKEMEKFIDKNCTNFTEKDILSEISLISEKLSCLSQTMNLYEDLLFTIRKKEGKRKQFSLEDRISIADVISKLDDEKSGKIAMIIKKNDQNFVIHGKEEVEVDFRILPDFIVEEIDIFLKKENLILDS